MTTVPRDGLGAGVGLVVRNRGWMWSSLCSRVSGRETSRMAGRVGLGGGELSVPTGLAGKMVLILRPSPVGGLDGGGLLGGVEVAGGKTLVKFGTSMGLNGGELGRETEG